MVQSFEILSPKPFFILASDRDLSCEAAIDFVSREWSAFASLW